MDRAYRQVLQLQVQQKMARIDVRKVLTKQDGQGWWVQVWACDGAQEESSTGVHSMREQH